MTEAGRLFLKVFPSVVLPMFLAVVDQTIVAAALPAIATTLGSIERVSWVVIAYLVATTIAAPVYGQLRDVAGSRRMMLVALTVFMAASVLCTLATSVEMLAVARILQGLGGGGLMTLSQALIGETIPPRERARYQGYLAAVMVTSSTFGPVAGGYMTEHFGWRSVFVVNVPLGVLAFVMALRLETKATENKAWRFDWSGLVLFVLFIAPLLLALSQLQRLNATTAWLSGGMLAVAAVSLVLLLRRERAAEHPLIPVKLLAQPVIWRCDALGACHGAMLVSLVTFLPLYFRVVRGLSASETGVFLLPLVIAIGLGSMITGRLVSHTGRTMVFPSVGLVFVTLGILIFGLWGHALSTQSLLWLLFGTGLFMGTVMGVVNVTVQRAAGTALGAAAASVQLSRSVGAAIGTALVGLVLFASISLMDPSATSLFATIVERGPTVIDALEPARQAIVRTEISSAFNTAFTAIAAFSLAGLALAWSIPARHI